mmetsp:Transcript_599/g.1736  ORF Transcript_599/g.1736 Transcript_599/m.1736 type:complete len:213 (+) Transcript_599:2972-3610(+)
MFLCQSDFILSCLVIRAPSPLPSSTCTSLSAHCPFRKTDRSCHACTRSWDTSPCSMPPLSNRRCPQGGLTTVKSGTSESSHFAALPARSRRLAVTPAAVASRHARSSAPSCTSHPTALPSQGRVAAFADLTASPQARLSKSTHCWNGQYVRFRPGATLRAISTASIRNVPLPHMGSAIVARGLAATVCGQPAMCSMPAAADSFRDARCMASR